MSEDPAILVVDDEPEIAAELAALIGRTGLAAIEAHDSPTAIDRFVSDARIGVVVTDVRMPRRSGIEFVRAIREIGERGRRARIIFCTGYADLNMAVDALRLGAVEFLRKPVEPSEMLAAVRRAADDYRKESDEHALDATAVRDLAQVVEQFRTFILTGNGAAAPDRATSPAQAATGGIAAERLRKTTHFMSIRKQRDAHLPVAEFDEALWFMLLELYQSQCTGERVSISSLCLSSGIPQTTALRRIEDLVARELVRRVPDPTDRRRAFVELSDEGHARISRFLDSISLELSGA
ncbi:MAG: response regulator [Alphaproteobacteria bacterium]|nr:response regulator [Alphaproteobacteria bacterium]